MRILLFVFLFSSKLLACGSATTVPIYVETSLQQDLLHWVQTDDFDEINTRLKGKVLSAAKLATWRDDTQKRSLLFFARSKDMVDLLMGNDVPLFITPAVETDGYLSALHDLLANGYGEAAKTLVNRLDNENFGAHNGKLLTKSVMDGVFIRYPDFGPQKRETYQDAHGFLDEADLKEHFSNRRTIVTEIKKALAKQKNVPVETISKQLADGGVFTLDVDTCRQVLSLIVVQGMKHRTKLSHGQSMKRQHSQPKMTASTFEEIAVEDV